MSLKNRITTIIENVCFKTNCFIEPLLLTSIILLPISLIYFKKKYYLLSFIIFLNGVASYFYHLKQIYLKQVNQKQVNQKQVNQKQVNEFYKYDSILSVISFLLSLFLAAKLNKKNKYYLSFIVILAFLSYILNYYYESYNFHLIWHLFVFLGQLFLALKIKNKI